MSTTIAALHDTQTDTIEIHREGCRDVARKQREGYDLLLSTTVEDEEPEHELRDMVLEACDPDDLGYRERTVVRYLACTGGRTVEFVGPWQP